DHPDRRAGRGEHDRALPLATWAAPERGAAQDRHNARKLRHLCAVHADVGDARQLRRRQRVEPQVLASIWLAVRQAPRASPKTNSHEAGPGRAAIPQDGKGKERWGPIAPEYQTRAKAPKPKAHQSSHPNAPSGPPGPPARQSPLVPTAPIPRAWLSLQVCGGPNAAMNQRRACSNQYPRLAWMNKEQLPSASRLWASGGEGSDLCVRARGLRLLWRLRQSASGACRRSPRSPAARCASITATTCPARRSMRRPPSRRCSLSWACSTISSSSTNKSP